MKRSAWLYLLLLWVGLIVATRTLTFTPAPTVERHALTETAISGLGDFTHRFDAKSRALYKFTLQLGPIVKSEAECLSALHAYLRGHKPFLWDGGPYHTQNEFASAGEGDGVRRQFFLPNRYIGGTHGASSLSIRTLRPSTGATSAWISSAYSLHPFPGLVTFGSAPASGDLIQAKYANFYRVNFSGDGLRLDQIGTDLYTAEFELLENPFTPPDLVLQPPNLIFREFLSAQRGHTAEIARHAPKQYMRISAQAKGTPALVTRGGVRTIISAVEQMVARLTTAVPQRRISLSAKARITGDVRVTPIGGVPTQTARGRTQVPSGQPAVTIFTGLVGSERVTMVPDWNTTWWINSYASDRAFVQFGTEAGSGGNWVDWGTFSAAAVPITAYNVQVNAQMIGRPVLSRIASVAIPSGRGGHSTVGSGATTFTVSTGLTNSAYVTIMPNWNTTWRVNSRTATHATIVFGTQIGSGGGNIDWGAFT